MHIHTYIHAYMHAHVHIHIHVHLDWCCFYYFVRNSLVALLEALCARIFSWGSWISGFSWIPRQKIFSAAVTTPRRVKQYHKRTYASMYICKNTHVYMHIHICAQPAANVLQMCTLMSKEHLYNAYSCTCTGTQNTCSKVHATSTAKKCTCIYTYTRMHTHE